MSPGSPDTQASPWTDWQDERLDRFGRVSRLAARLFDVPVAWIVDESDEDVHRFFQSLGAHADGSSVERTWSGPERRGRGSRRRPWAPGDCGLRFLVRYELTDAAGRRLGSLVLADRRARQLDAASKEVLLDLARTVEAELDLARRGSVDGLTGLYNRCGFEHLAGTALDLCRRHRRPARILYFDLDGFKQINDTQGHAEGDRALVAFAGLLRQSFRRGDLMARLGGDEFAVLAAADESHGHHPGLQRLDAALAEYNARPGQAHRLAYSVGVTAVSGDDTPGLHAALAAADEAMYACKRERRGLPLTP